MWCPIESLVSILNRISQVGHRGCRCVRHVACDELTELFWRLLFDLRPIKHFSAYSVRFSISKYQSSRKCSAPIMVKHTNKTTTDQSYITDDHSYLPFSFPYIHVQCTLLFIFAVCTGVYFSSVHCSMLAIIMFRKS
jgi:hypothetical protein